MKHSIIIPAYNAALYIQESVKSALSQLSANDEIIIIDDGSTDATRKIVLDIYDPRIRLLCQSQNSGIACARNQALEITSGDYVHFLDHDDLWSKDRMLVLTKIIRESHPELISGWVEHFFCPTLNPTQTAQYQIPPPQAASLPGSTIIRRDLLNKIGLFDTSLSSGEFIDYLSRATTLNPRWIKTNSIFFLRRIHNHNHTHSDATLNSSYIEVIRRHLSRKFSV